MATLLDSEQWKAAVQVQGRIKKLRTGLLAFRYLYYCQQQSLVTDFVYDAREFELRTLVESYPEIACNVEYDDICPTKTVGSDSVVDYPDEIMDLAERLACTHAELDGRICPVHSTEELLVALEGITIQPVTQPGLFTS